MTSFERIIGRLVVDIPQTMQVLQAFVVSSFRADFANPHKFIARNTDGIAEAVTIPELKQRHIQTHMGRIEGFVHSYFFEKTSKVFDIIHLTSHLGLNKGSEDDTLFELKSWSRSVIE